MSYLTIKWIKGHPYLYQVHSEREGDRVRQVFERYLGRAETAEREVVPVERKERIRRPAVAAVSEAVAPTGVKPSVTPEVTIPRGIRPDLYVADIEGMMPETANRVKTVRLPDGSELAIMSDEGDIYGLIDGKEVGFATKLSDTETDLSVAMEYRNKGIGTELMRQFQIENPEHPTGGLTEGGKKVIERLAEIQPITPTEAVAPSVAVEAETPAPAKPTPPIEKVTTPITPEVTKAVTEGIRERIIKPKVFIPEGVSEEQILWHGTPSGKLIGGTSGLHIGTFEAARQALEARIGIPADGIWDGTREYGKTLLAGKKTMEARGDDITGYNVDAPTEDYYPTGRAVYSGNIPVELSSKPDMIPVRITGKMTNTPSTAYEDFKAGGYMSAQIKRGTAKSGYYYVNQGEDAGSISAVLPNEQHISKLEKVAPAPIPKAEAVTPEAKIPEVGKIIPEVGKPVTPEVTSWYLSAEGKPIETQFRTLSTMTGGGANLLQTPEGQLIERIATGKQKGWWKTIIDTTEYVGKTPERVVEIVRERGVIIPKAKALVPELAIPKAEVVTPTAPVTPEVTPEVIHRGTEPEGIKTADKVGIMYDGKMGDAYQFTVPKGMEGEGITFYVKDLGNFEKDLITKYEAFIANPSQGQTAEGLKAELENMRAKFTAPAVEPTPSIQELQYSRDLDIRNIEALPKGTGAKYLITLKGQGDELIAKQWARVKPTSLKPDEVLVSMTPPVAEKIEPTAVKVIFNRPFGGSKGGFAIMDYKTTTPIDDPIAKQKIIDAYNKVKSPVGFATYNSIHKETKLPYETILGVLKQAHINDPYSIHFDVDRMGKNIYFKLDRLARQG